ncbi:MAG: Glu/Leu/Phe/Val dehydrogenase [Deltaproteobacteria bacterium]|nr:MAG: Glu/Leu/Phe/Val dehydrogenase [Deltaproteobacteria bacterium]
MEPFGMMDALGHEQVVFCRDEASGLKAIIAIHDTTLGPSLGGCRMFDYRSEAEALTDVLRLSRGMTYKAAIAGLDLGGGKAVIVGPRSSKSEAMFRAFGRFVDALGGRYITAEDMNTNEQDMEFIGRETRWVTGRSPAAGGTGNPGPVTAWGVFHGLRGALHHATGSPSVEGRTVAIQGLGNVGYGLAKHLRDAGAELLLCDVNQQSVERALDELGGEPVEGDDFYRAPCDVLAPCAVGGVISARTIPMVQASIICGGANNILDDEDRDGQALRARGIVYAPDYVVNGGGIMSVNGELRGESRDKVLADAARIYETVREVLGRADREDLTSVRASNLLAEARIAAIGSVKGLWTGKV